MTPDTLDALVESLEKRALVMTDDPVYRRALDAIAALRVDLEAAQGALKDLLGDFRALREQATYYDGAPLNDLAVALEAVDAAKADRGLRERS